MEESKTAIMKTAGTDRELLELAAKAARLKDARWDDFYKAISHTAENGIKDCPWNPMTSDAEALRLAAELRLEIKPGKHVGDGCTVETQRGGIAGCTAFCDDKSEQMRRAIVIAAANIGEAMP